MIVSAGQLHSSARLLDMVASTPVPAAALREMGGLVLVCPVEDVLNLSSRCGWVVVDGDGRLHPSARGSMLRDCADFQLRLREQIRDVIASTQPAWSKMLMHGRHEVERYAPADVVQCFSEAGLLMGDPGDDVIRWWDELGNLARGVKSAANLEVGRRGEKLSLAYEHARTGQQPVWQSIESSFSGYDVLSTVSAENLAPMQIEVKASELRPKDAVLYLTRHEWETAQQAQAHVFHLWHLGEQPQLAVIDLATMAPHVPDDRGQGEWRTIGIRFQAFLPQLRSVRMNIPAAVAIAATNAVGPFSA